VIDERPRRDPLKLRCLDIAVAVLVGSGQKEDLIAALAMKPGERIGARLLVRMTQVGCAVDVIDGRREVELLGVRIGILSRHGRRRAFVSRAFLGILTRVLLVIFTFVLIVALAQLALVSASTRAEHLGLGEVVRRAWEGTQDYFGSLLQGSLGEASSTSILGGRRRSMGEVLLDAYPKSMVLVGLAVLVATILGLVVGVAAAATSSRRLRGALLSVTVLAVSTPSFLLAILLILLSATMVSRYGIRLWPSFGFGWDDHLVLPVIVLAARPFAQIASFAYVAVDETLGSDYVRTARSKGLKESVILIRHALGNAWVPILGAIAAALSIALSTLPVVEVFFSWPGLGFSLLLAIRRFDAATAGTLLGSLAVTIAIVRFALDAIASRLVHRATGAAA
jgi:peptide/nickel transport system permease protein